MPFELSASNIHTYAQLGAHTDYTSHVYGAIPPWENSPSRISGYYTQGDNILADDDFLTNLRYLQSTSLKPLDLGPSTDLPGLPLIGYDGLDAHSMATLTILLYADVAFGGITDWKSSSQYFWSVMYDNNFAGSIGFNNLVTLGGGYQAAGDYSGILRQTIAYSILDEGTPIFGDTAIRAFYDDANDFGKAIVGGNSNLGKFGTDISKVFVQYAGELALNKILLSSLSSSINGVLSVANAASNHTLSIDLSDVTWKAANKNILPDMGGRDALVNDLLKDMDAGSGIALRTEMKALWGNDQNNVFEKVVFSTDASYGNNLTSAPSSVSKAQIYIGGDGSDSQITGSTGNDLLYGSSGVDKINGGSGNDILVGGLGIDKLYGDDGNDILIGRGSFVSSAASIEPVEGDSFDGGIGSGDRLTYAVGNSTLYVGANDNDHAIKSKVA